MKYIKTAIVLGLMACLFHPLSSLGAKTVELIPIDPLPASGKAVFHAPLSERPGYNKRGKIDSISGNEIVINDILRYLNSSTQVYSSSDTASSKRILLPGKWVEYKMDTNNTILKIRILKN